MIKAFRIVLLYFLFWPVAFLAGLLIFLQNVDIHIAFTFVAPILGVWFVENRIAQKKRKRDEELLAKARKRDEVEQTDAIRRDKKNLIKAVNQHRSPLQRNFRKAVTTNDYGALVRDDRDIATEDFLQSVNIHLEGMQLEEAKDYIQALLDGIEQEDAREGFDVRRMPTNGLDFEEYVATGLQSFGWDAKPTQGSGDQGIDVIASKEGISLGIQCKLYSSAVGNKAVQEAYSGARHFGLDRAAVLSNAEFTQSAKELAASTGVLLLSPEDIPTLGERLTLRP